MTIMKAMKMKTTTTTTTAMVRSKLTPNLNVRRSYGGRAVRVAMSVRRGEIEALLGKSTSFNNIRVRGERPSGGCVDGTMLSRPRRDRLGIVGYVTQEPGVFRGLVAVHDKIRLETGVSGASGVQQGLEAFSLQAVKNSKMGRALAWNCAGGPPKVDEPFAGEVEGVAEIQLRRLDDMEMLITFQNRLCDRVDMGCVMASGAASPGELCQGVKKYYLGEGFQRWECSLWSPLYGW